MPNKSHWSAMDETRTMMWKSAFAGDIAVFDTVKFDMPVSGEMPAVRTISGSVTGIDRKWDGKSPIVRFEVEGEMFTVRPDFHLFIAIVVKTTDESVLGRIGQMPFAPEMRGKRN